ncbi:MAG: response regulator [Magnetococcales bacterium]|nr:response regulator [Magnetococcales bacterium]
MTTTNPPSAQARIAQLRRTFLKQLPARLDQAQGLLQRLTEDPANARETAVELHRMFHSLKGSGRSFGFVQLGATAAQGEAWLTAHLESQSSAPPPDLLPILGDYLAQIAWQVEELQGVAGLKTSEPAIAIRCEEDPSQAGERLVYLCHDDRALLEHQAKQMECCGYTVRVFTDPGLLRDAVQARWPEAVVMEIGFPHGGRAGLATLAALETELGRSPQVILLAAQDDFDTRLLAVRHGSLAFCHADVDAMELVAILDKLPPPQEPEPFRILIIDDEPEVAAYHGIILEEAGMLTRQLSDPARVLEALHEFPCDMILMDMYMPVCHGRELARLIRQVPEFAGLPIVFLSGETDHKKQISAMRVGAEGFLTKPVSQEDLIVAVAIRAERMRTLRSLTRAKEEAERANKAKTAFLSFMSHELRSPLNGVIGFCQLLELDPVEPLTPAQKESVAQIMSCGDHLLELINGLLDMARIEAGRVIPEMEVLNPASIMEHCLGMTTPLARKRFVSVSFVSKETPFPNIYVDPLRLKQILINLLSNAVKYNRKGGYITVTHRATREGLLEISIADSGRGIPKEQWDQVFKPFHRLGAEKIGIEGSGIGLNITKTLVEAMGGHIGFNSEPEKGTRFWVTFPIVDHPPSEEIQ